MDQDKSKTTETTETTEKSETTVVQPAPERIEITETTEKVVQPATSDDE